MFDIFDDIPQATKTSEPISGATEKKPRLTAAERLQKRKEKETKSEAPKVEQPKKELELDLKEATKSVGGLLVAISKTKKPLTENEVEAMSATSEKSLSLALNTQDENTSKWIVHSQTLIVWAGTLLPRFFPDLFSRNGVATQTETEKKE